MIKITKALPEQAQKLSELAQQSKAYWGYSADFMQAVVAELTYSPEDITKHITYLASIEGQVVGFYQLIVLSYEYLELEALFVDPNHIGKGVGSQLFLHAIKLAASKKCKAIKIQSDPFASKFYLGHGCIQVGELESVSIPGRQLPLLQYDLNLVAD